MRRFNFKLQKILELKQFKEEEAKNELGKAISILNSIENEIKQNATKRLQASQLRFTDPTQVYAWEAYIARLQQETQRLMEQAAQAEMIVEEKREIYMEAYREMKSIEKLKEKREKEYHKDMLNTEMNILDDIVTSRHSVV